MWCVRAVEKERSEMDNYLISVGTITYAIKGRDLLRDLGFKANITRKTGASGAAGCGYSIRIEGDLDKAMDALIKAGIKVQ